MTTIKNINEVKYYMCDECYLIYNKKRDALLCEEWCRNNKSCNLEITKKALKNNS